MTVISNDWVNKKFLTKPNLILCLVISTCFCLYIILGENSIINTRFTAGHDPSILYRTGFDLIHALSGGNLTWSLFDLSNHTYLSFGTIAYSLFSFPIAVIYYLLHLFLPNIPENILYRNTFVFVFFPLTNLVLTYGVYLWLNLLRVNNYFVSVLVIPIMVAISANEIWGMLLNSPTIALFPYLFVGSTLIIQRKYKLGLTILFFSSLICFIQTPLLFCAYLLPIPWCFIVIYGLIRFFTSSIEKKDTSIALVKRDSVKNILPKLSIYLILIVATVFSIGKLSYTVASKTHRHDMIHDVIGNKSIGLLLTEKVFPFLSYPWDTSIGWLFELGARVSFLSLIFLIIYTSISGILGFNYDYKKGISKYLNHLKDKINISFHTKIRFACISLGISYLIFEVIMQIIDLKYNFHTEAHRLNGFFDITSLHKRGYTQKPILDFFHELVSYNSNEMLNGNFGYFGYLPLLFCIIGIFIYIQQRRNRYTFISLSICLLLFIGLSTTFNPICILFFLILSLIYPLAALGNNLSMTHYVLDYLTIPYVAIGTTMTLKTAPKILNSASFSKIVNKLINIKNILKVKEGKLTYIKQLISFLNKVFNIENTVLIFLLFYYILYLDS